MVLVLGSDSERPAELKVWCHALRFKRRQLGFDGVVMLISFSSPISSVSFTEERNMNINTSDFVVLAIQLCYALFLLLFMLVACHLNYS